MFQKGELGKGREGKGRGGWRETTMNRIHFPVNSVLKGGLHATICRPDLTQISYENGCKVCC